jgi:DNA repair exonuclease SbcCD ATPase subunit
MNSGNSELRGELSELSVAIRMLESERDDALAHNARLVDRVRVLEAALARERPERLLASVAELQSSLSHLGTRVRALELELGERDDALRFARSDAAEARAALDDALEHAKRRELNLASRVQSLEASLDSAKQQTVAASAQRDAALAQLQTIRDRDALAQRDADDLQQEQRRTEDEQRRLTGALLLASAKKRKLSRRSDADDDDDDGDDDDNGRVWAPRQAVPNSKPGSVLQGIRAMLGEYVSSFASLEDQSLSLLESDAAAAAAAAAAL